MNNKIFYINMIFVWIALVGYCQQQKSWSDGAIVLAHACERGMHSSNIPRVDDRRVGSGIIYAIKHGLQWKDAPDEYGPHKTLYNRFVRWNRNGIFNKIFNDLKIKYLLMAPWWSTPPIWFTARRQARSKRGFSTSYRTNKRRTEFQTPYHLWRAWASCPAFADWRTGQRRQGCSHPPASPPR